MVDATDRTALGSIQALRTVTALVCALAMVGCAVNEATGKRQLDLVGEARELELGREADRGVVAQMGLYEDVELAAKVADVGAALARVSERPGLPWRVVVVDDPVVNAFALPGGYLYVSRGILAHFNSEAELAGVLGHEVGHVTARHGIERVSKAQLANIGFGVAAIASEEFRRFGGVAQLGMQLLFLKFSRDDERESDTLGLRYMNAAGWDPEAMPRVFETLDRVSAASGSRVPEWTATHPSPERRAAGLRERVALIASAERGTRLERDSYLEALDGLVFGADPRQGYAVANRYYHPALRFQLEAPPGWRIVDERSRLVFLAPDQDAMVQLEIVDASTPDEAARTFFSRDGIARGGSWRPGYSAFTTTANPETGRYLQGVAGFLSHEGKVFRLLAVTRDDRWPGRREALTGAAGSFRQLSQPRYLEVEPARLAVERLERPTAIADLARRADVRLEAAALATLNGVEPSAVLAAGTLVKLPFGRPLPAD